MDTTFLYLKIIVINLVRNYGFVTLFDQRATWKNSKMLKWLKITPMETFTWHLLLTQISSNKSHRTDINCVHGEEVHLSNNRCIFWDFLIRHNMPLQSTSAHLRCPHISPGSLTTRFSSCQCSWGCWTSNLHHIFSSLWKRRRRKEKDEWFSKTFLPSDAHGSSTCVWTDLWETKMKERLTIFVFRGLSMAVRAAPALWGHGVSLAQLSLEVHVNTLVMKWTWNYKW